MIGATDEYGYKVELEPYSVHDLHATILHALGLDHRRLTYYYGLLRRAGAAADQLRGRSDFESVCVRI